MKYLEELIIEYDRKVMNLQQENKQLKEKIDILLEDNKQLEEIRIKAIDYIKENSYMARDKEINGIPLMSKRLDKCDDLLEILGGKE